MVTVKRGLVVGEKSVIYRGLGIMQMLKIVSSAIYRVLAANCGAD